MDAIFRQADIQAVLTENILQTAWEKFVFISPLATLTSYLDVLSSEVLLENNKKLLSLLSAEIIAVAYKKGIMLPTDIIDKTLHKIRLIPPGTTTSMHRDFKNRKPTEIESLCGYVIDQGARLGVPTPTYQMIYDNLLMRE